MLRLTLGTFSTVGTPMQNPSTPTVGGNGGTVVDAPPNTFWNAYGMRAPLLSVGGGGTLPGTTVVVTDPGGGQLPTGAIMVPTSPGPVIMQPTSTTPPQVIVDPTRDNPPPAGTQFTVSPAPAPSLFSSISAQLTPVRIFAGALAIGAAAIGAIVASRVRRRGGTSVD